MPNFLLQWNIRGLKQNYIPGLQPLINEMEPQVISLQETKLANDFEINKYKPYHYINKDSAIAAGGTSLFIKNDLPQNPIKIDTNMQAIAVRVTAFRPITICSVYIPPKEKINYTQLHKLQNQLPEPYLIVGDFNAHSPLWEQTNTTDQKGKALEDFLSKTNSFLLNDTSPTYLIPASLKTSSVDLSMCSPVLAPTLNCATLKDTHLSDHYPIIIKTDPPVITPPQEYFNFRKANWPSFFEECKTKLNTKIENKSIDYFTEKLLEITESNIPKISTSPRKNKAWFNEDCAKAVKMKNHMLRMAKANGTQENIKNFKIAQANCRKTCREAKKSSFKKYISKINNKTPMNKIWKMIKKLKGTHRETFKHILKEDGSFAETKTDIANEIAASLSKNCSSENYNKTFQQNKIKQEKNVIQFPSNNSEIYNKKFTTAEIKTCVSELSLTAAGPDKIHNNILTHLPQESVDLLQDIFNDIWEKQLFPDSWRKATIIPIPKPNKDHTNPTNYRPIALTSCLCKLMEKLVNKRLMWYLETNNKLSKFQSGFRKGRSTIDQLIRLKTFIRNAFLKEEHQSININILIRLYCCTIP